MIKQGKTIDQLDIGQRASMRKTITEADVSAFAQISGDTNPVHLDKEYAAKTIFKERVAHGMLTAGLISAVLGTRLPGVGSIYLSQSLKFVAPVKLGDTVEAEVEVIEKLEEKNRVRLRTVCRNQSGQVVIDGEALIMIMPPKSA
jgi:3-hydroxybutyryl-CoA dehydratase